MTILLPLMPRPKARDPHQTQMSELSAQLEGFLKGTPEDIVCVEHEGPLSHIPLFARLESSEQAELRGLMTPEHVQPNQTVFWLGDKGDTFYLVESGGVVVTVPNSKGEHVTIASLGPGGFFGEISLLDGGVRTATVRATEPSLLLALNRLTFQRFLLKHPSAALDVLAVMGQRQRTTNEVLRRTANPNEVFEQSRVTAWQRVSDIIATVAASQWFTMFHLAWFGVWIMLNVIGALMQHPPKFLAFDPFPFGLLTMVVSLEAIFLSIFVMVSQNRQSEKDRMRTDLDYQVNLKAETEIVSIARKLETIEATLEELRQTRR